MSASRCISAPCRWPYRDPTRRTISWASGKPLSKCVTSVVGRRGRSLAKRPLVVEVAGGTMTASKWFAILAVAVGMFYWLVP